jgi:hypothetical protein
MPTGMPGDLRVRGAAVVYRLFDVGYEIRLDKALGLLAASAPELVHLVHCEAQAIHIPNPPVSVVLGEVQLSIAGQRCDAQVSARLFDFGVASIRVTVPAPEELAWPRFSAFGNAVNGDAAIVALVEQHLQQLRDRVATAIERPSLAPVSEQYVVYRLTALARDGVPVQAADALTDADVVSLLLNESRPLSADARHDLMPHRFSYYGDDLAILTWDNALVVDPAAGDTDVQLVLEFANAQLLELRFYDALLDGELPRMYERAARARSVPRAFPSRRFAHVLSDLHTLVADTTELVERAENALKVTDDVYLARVYAAALEIFRARVWRTGIDRKLTIIRDTYGMLNDEAEARRSETLEIAVVALIVLELLLGILR